MNAVAIKATIAERLEPIELIRLAIHWAATTRGLAVEPGPHGIRRTSIEGRGVWIPDHLTRYVDPLGAVVLMRQPLDPIMPAAAAEALGVSVPFVEGFAVGNQGRAPLASWARAAARATYLAGFELGVRVRLEVLTERCPTDGTRYRHGTECPACDAREGAAGDELPARGRGVA